MVARAQECIEVEGAPPRVADDAVREAIPRVALRANLRVYDVVELRSYVPGAPRRVEEGLPERGRGDVRDPPRRRADDDPVEGVRVQLDLLEGLAAAGRAAAEVGVLDAVGFGVVLVDDLLRGM